MTAWMRSRVENGILVTETSLRTTCVVELGFPPRYAQPRLEPELGYLAVVLDGGLQKTFANRTLVLGAGTATTIPADAGHSATFGERGARILIVKPQSTADEPVSRASAVEFELVATRVSRRWPAGSRPSWPLRTPPRRSLWRDWLSSSSQRR